MAITIGYITEKEDNKMNKQRIRLEPEDRRRIILDEAVKLAAKIGYHKVFQKNLAQRLNISSGLILYYFKSMTRLRREIIKAAIEQENLIILREAIALKDPAVRNLNANLKRKIFKEL